jgi:hypothetical protein
LSPSLVAVLSYLSSMTVTSVWSLNMLTARDNYVPFFSKGYLHNFLRLRLPIVGETIGRGNEVLMYQTRLRLFR